LLLVHSLFMYHAFAFASSAFLCNEAVVCVVVLVAWSAVLEVAAAEALGCLSVPVLGKFGPSSWRFLLRGLVKGMVGRGVLGEAD